MLFTIQFYYYCRAHAALLRCFGGPAAASYTEKSVVCHTVRHGTGTAAVVVCALTHDKCCA